MYWGFRFQVSGVRCQRSRRPEERPVTSSKRLIASNKHILRFVLVLVLEAFKPLSIEDEDEHDLNTLF